jgi:lipopolysaccharide biosynthesis regulator YciM
VQVHDREAVQELERARSLEPGPERDSALAEAERHLDWILDHGLVETAEVHHELGSIHWTRGEIPEAEAAMRRALELDPSFTHSRLVLADIEMRRGAEERALDELQAVLEREPDSAHVGRRLEELVARGAESSRPYRMLVGVLTARNQRNEAEQVIDLLESRTGPSDETEALRRELRAKR